MKNHTPTSAMTAMGALIRKTEPQSKLFRSQPATRGPRGRPRKVAAPAMATARGLCFGLKMVGRIDSISGMMIAALAPISARIQISPVADVIWLATTEATPKVATPISIIRRRPRRSERTPAGSRKPASARVNAAEIHCSSLVLAPSLADSVGSAVTRIVASSPSTSPLRLRAASANQRPRPALMVPTSVLISPAYLLECRSRRQSLATPIFNRQDFSYGFDNSLWAGLAGQRGGAVGAGPQGLERGQPEAVVVGDVGEAEARFAAVEVVVGRVSPGDLRPELDRTAVGHPELERQPLAGLQAVGSDHPHAAGADVDHLLEARLRRLPVGDRRRLDPEMMPSAECHARSLCGNRR